jgi:hypothetical protein
MALIIFGIALLLIGLLFSTNALGIIDWAAQRWPARFDRGTSHLMASTGFLIRFVGLLVALAGAAVLLREIFYD